MPTLKHMWVRPFDAALARLRLLCCMEQVGMRCLFAVLAFVLFSPSGESQSSTSAWHPLPKSHQRLRYDYQRADHMVPAYPLWADSMTVAAGDTTWWLHPYPAICDTIPAPWPNLVARYHPGLPQPFGGTTLVTGGSGIHMDSEAGPIDVFPRSALGTPWLAHPTEAWTAWVDARFDSLLWGTTLDSVAQILLSTGDTLLLSKAHGMLRFPSVFAEGDSFPYRLAGIRSLSDLGSPLPDWKQLFAFQSGTALEYAYAHASTFYRMDATIQLDINDVLWNGDTVEVLLDGQLWVTTGGDPFDAANKDDSAYCLLDTRWRFTKDSFFMPLETIGTCPIAVGVQDNWHPFDLPPYAWHPHHRGNSFSELRYDVTHAAQSIANRRIMSTAGAFPMDAYADWRNQAVPFAFGPDGDTTQSSLLYQGYFPGEYDNLGYTAAEGLGMVRIQKTFVHSNSTLKLSAYKTVADSLGTFQDLSVYAPSTSPESSFLTLTTSPNPSLGVFRLSNWGSPGQLHVFDARGQSVWEQSVQPFQELDLGSLAPGIYWLELSNEAVTGVAKISILKP